MSLPVNNSGIDISLSGVNWVGKDTIKDDQTSISGTFFGKDGVQILNVTLRASCGAELKAMINKIDQQAVESFRTIAKEFNMGTEKGLSKVRVDLENRKVIGERDGMRPGSESFDNRQVLGDKVYTAVRTIASIFEPLKGAKVDVSRPADNRSRSQTVHKQAAAAAAAAAAAQKSVDNSSVKDSDSTKVRDRSGGPDETSTESADAEKAEKRRKRFEARQQKIADSEGTKKSQSVADLDK